MRFAVVDTRARARIVIISLFYRTEFPCDVTVDVRSRVAYLRDYTHTLDRYFKSYGAYIVYCRNGSDASFARSLQMQVYVRNRYFLNYKSLPRLRLRVKNRSHVLSSFVPYYQRSLAKQCIMSRLVRRQTRLWGMSKVPNFTRTNPPKSSLSYPTLDAKFWFFLRISFPFHKLSGVNQFTQFYCTVWLFRGFFFPRKQNNIRV